MDFTLDATNRIVRTRAWDELAGSELVDHLERITRCFAEGALDASWAQIVDLADIRSLLGVTTAIIRRLAENNPWPEQSFRVVIAPGDVSFGLARMYQLLGAGATDNVKITRSKEEAEVWFARRPEA